MTQDESIIAVDIRTIEIPNVSGNHLISVAMVRANGGESYVTPVKIPGVLVEDLMEIESRLPYSAEEHFHAPPPSQVRNVVKAGARGHTVLAYNLEHDSQYLPFLDERDHYGRRIFRVQDVMLRAAPYVADWNPFFASYEYPPLKIVAETFGLSFEKPGWHSARANAQMTLDIWAYMEANPPSYRANKMLLPDAKVLLPYPAATRFSTTVDDLPF